MTRRNDRTMNEDPGNRTEPTHATSASRVITPRLIALVAMMVLAHMAFTGGRVSLMLYAIKLQASTATVGLLVSLLSVVPMVLSVHMGRWTDRVGVFKPALIALTFIVAGTLLPALQPSIALLGIASVFLGSGFMLMHVTINNAVGHASTAENRPRAFTVLALGFSTSSILGPVIAGFTIDHAGYAATFVTLAVFPVLSLAALRYTSRGAAPHAPLALPPEGAHVMDLLRDGPMRAVFVVSCLLSMGWDMFIFMVPVQGARIGLSAANIGVIMGTFGVATFVVRLGMPWLSRRLSEWQTLTFALGVTAFVYLVFPLLTALPVLLALAFVLGLGLGSAQPMVMSLIHRVAPAGRTGEAVGVRTGLLNTSQVFMPLLFGAFSTAAGTVPAFWILAMILAAGGVFAGKSKGLDG